MDHQNIARVLDAGTTDSGRPYFVMELVNGVPITRYCDDAQLSPRERLELFAPVCQAIQHAHQKGIIHRDIKPSNVLVTLYDGKPVPKVIDFGVAKAIDQRLTERTMFTQYGSVVGTLEYMSPEQAEMSALGVDTRSDIYSLGVLLYELLTGSTPLERATLREAGYAEILRQIKEEEPPKPSTRLSDSSERLPSISAQRHTEPARLTRLVRGELDWIVMKALEKDRTRRYETANGFARDIARYLAGDPVEAGPPSATYKLRKLAQTPGGAVDSGGIRGTLAAGRGDQFLPGRAGEPCRNQGAAGGCRGRAGSPGGSRAEESGRGSTQPGGRCRTGGARRGSQGQEVRVRGQGCAGVFPDESPRGGAAQGPGRGPGHQRHHPCRGGRGRDGDRKVLAGQPTVEASIRDTLGQGYLYLSDPAGGIPHHERALALRRQALGSDHPDTLTSMSSLANAYWYAGRLADAVTLHEETLKRRQAKLGPDHLDTLESMNSLALAYHDSGRLAEALPLYEESLRRLQTRHGFDHPDSLTYMNNLASAYQDSGRLPEALPLYEAALKGRQATLGSDHPDTLALMSQLAGAYLGDKPAQAETLLRQALAILDKKSPDGWQNFKARSLLGASLLGQKKYAEAEPFLLQGYDGMKAREARIPAPSRRRLPAAGKRIVTLYNAWGKQNMAEEWTKKLDTPKKP